MMDDLQQAYAAYQNALINLRNPKVYSTRIVIVFDLQANILPCRNQSSGMASVYCTTAMDLWTMPRKPSPKSCRCSQTLRRPTRSTSVSV